MYVKSLFIFHTNEFALCSRLSVIIGTIVSNDDDDDDGCGDDDLNTFESEHVVTAINCNT